MSFSRNITKLAEVGVKIGLNLRAGQKLIIHAPIEAVELAREATRIAYEQGASLVTVLYNDDQLDRIKFEHGEVYNVAPGWLWNGIDEALKDNTARMVILGRSPTAMKGIDPSKLAEASKAMSIAAKSAMTNITESRINWTIIPFATVDWAKEVFPDLEPNKAHEQLWEKIFQSTRVDQEDPIENWQAHNEKLHAKAKMMNEHNFDALHFTGPGTDLIVGLAEGHIWEGGSGKAENGIEFNANIPTEEIFTTPHCNKVNGTVSSTKPLFHNGQIIDGIKVTFKDGLIVESSAEVGYESFKSILDADAGSSRIGEVALVPHSSPISKSGVIYKNTLFDENAACHIALGQSYSKCMTSETSEKTLKDRGANSSIVHVDWMIGSDKIDIIGIKDNDRIQIFKNGEWVI